MPAPIFVFGSNEAGIHGLGSALVAYINHGAVRGNGFGPQGNSYAIPTKDRRLKALPLDRIRDNITEFITYANAHPELTFHVVRIGCGYAGYTDTDIAPMFANAPTNCELPEGWR